MIEDIIMVGVSDGKNNSISNFEHEKNNEVEAHLYTSIYKICNKKNTSEHGMKQEYRVPIYAIRFMYDYSKDNKDSTGNRYKCAYRYMIHT